MVSRNENELNFGGNPLDAALQATNEWPEDGKETVNCCPVCGGKERSVVHASLTDRIFFCAPGVWMLHRCDACGCGYVDPRPTPSAIGLAYAEYYTHTLDKYEVFLSNTSPLGKRFIPMRNGYLNARFPRFLLFPSHPLGSLVMHLFPATRALAERDVRHLPAPVEGAKLLDIGCGSGAFVRRAISLGYSAEGLEFDAAAVAAAAKEGIPVREGSLPDTGLPNAGFDVVMLSQVIEHLHDPMAALREIHRLLKPGGLFWLATPNMDAPGHVHFGADWRGLEPPRHLVLFSPKALNMALEQSGFEGVEFKPPGAVSHWFYRASHRISMNQKPEADISLPSGLTKLARREDRLSLHNPVVGEELVAVARKPERTLG